MIKLILITQSTNNSKKRQLFFDSFRISLGSLLPVYHFSKNYARVPLGSLVYRFSKNYARVPLRSQVQVYSRPMLGNFQYQRELRVYSYYYFVEFDSNVFVLLLSLFYLMVKPSKSFVKMGSCFQIALFFLFYQNFQLPAYSDLPFAYLILPNVPTHLPFHPTPSAPLIRTPLFLWNPRVIHSFQR